MTQSAAGSRPDLVPESLRDKARRWRRALKSRLPYVRRRTFNIAEQRLDTLIEDISMGWCASDSVEFTPVREARGDLGAEVCLFVTYASGSTLKSHVATHVRHLHAAGIQVVLIVNADRPAHAVHLEPALLDCLCGAYIRENRGFDFAAWSHAWKHLDRLPGCTRLFLINDSIVGPFNSAHFAQIVERVRRSGADLVGLTESPEPRLHLQSYFLVVQGRALRSSTFQQFFDSLLCLPNKDWVIIFYETRVTGHLLRSGLTCEALFTGPRPGGYTSSDSRHRWAELIQAGFPFIKASVLAEQAQDPRLEALVPPDMRGSGT